MELQGHNISGLRSKAKDFLVRTFRVTENFTPEFKDVGYYGVGFVFIQDYNSIALTSLSIYSIRWDYQNTPKIETVLLHGKEMITGVSYNSGTITVTINTDYSLGCLVKFGQF